MYVKVNRVDNIIWKIIDDEIILLNPQTGAYFGLNAVSSDFWKYLEITDSLKDILHHLETLYDVPKEELISDINDLINKLLQRNVIEVE